MKSIRFFPLICLMAITTFFITACSKSDTNGSGVLNTAAQNVTIQAMAFQPATVTVVVGTKIVWTNMDATAHTVTSDDGTSFNSGNISPNGTFSFTPAVNGSYGYHCSIHPAMTGTIQVVTR